MRLAKGMADALVEAALRDARKTNGQRARVRDAA
jgi:hypothetical protein